MQIIPAAVAIELIDYARAKALLAVGRDVYARLTAGAQRWPGKIVDNAARTNLVAGSLVGKFKGFTDPVAGASQFIVLTDGNWIPVTQAAVYGTEQELKNEAVQAEILVRKIITDTQNTYAALKIGEALLPQLTPEQQNAFRARMDRLAQQYNERQAELKNAQFIKAKTQGVHESLTAVTAKLGEWGDAALKALGFSAIPLIVPVALGGIVLVGGLITWAILANASKKSGEDLIETLSLAEEIKAALPPEKRGKVNELMASVAKQAGGGPGFFEGIAKEVLWAGGLAVAAFAAYKFYPVLEKQLSKKGVAA